MAATPAPKTPPTKTETLPVHKVVLYKNGVGYFEHTGSVTGNQRVTIDFTTAQLNDVLQSLTAIDLNGGRIAGADYNSTTPLEQQLQSLPLGLGANPTAADFYSAVRGAQVEVTGQGAAFTGRLLNIETTTSAIPNSQETTDKRTLTVIGDNGAVRVFDLTPALQVRLLDADLHQSVGHYLQLLADSRNQGLRHLTLDANGTGTRSLLVSYISEVPVWKSTYRILITPAASGDQTATLQGWAVIDNTIGTDWDNVQLSLIAGAPQSFIQPLSQPYYARRAEIPLPAEAETTPQTFDSSIEDDKQTASPIVSPSIAMAGRGRGFGTGSGSGMGSAGMMAKGKDLDALSDDNALPAPQEYQSAITNSILPNTTTNAFDDYFEYKISQPVTIRKNQSALVPILQTTVPVQTVTLWNAADQRPLRALWLTNSSNLTLDRGSFTLLENGEFAGEGLLDPIHAAEKRLLSYAVDQAIHVGVSGDKSSSHITHVTIHDGVMHQSTAQIREATYDVHNSASETRDVLIEQPILNGWMLDSEPKPVETTASVYRFNVLTQPGETVHLHVGQRRITSQQYSLTSFTDSRFQLILRQGGNNPAIMQKLAPLSAAQQHLNDINYQINLKKGSIQQISDDQTRLRNNLTALKDTPEQRSLARRYTDELNQQEDQLAALKKDVDHLTTQQTEAKQQLNDQLKALDLDADL
jgi:hypothetical protein